MASIIDSFREVFADNFSFLKLLVFAIPLYFAYQLYSSSKGDYTLFLWVVAITLFFLFGFLAKTVNNVINDGSSILPSLNPLGLAFASIKSIVAILPSVIIYGWLANYLCSFINFSQQVDIYLESIIWLVASSFIVTVFLMFIKDENFLEIFNIKVILTKVGDLVVGILFFILQSAVMNGLVMGVIGYTLFILFGTGFIFYFFIALALVFNVGVTGHYLAQLQYDNLGYGKPSA